MVNTAWPDVNQERVIKTVPLCSNFTLSLCIHLFNARNHELIFLSLLWSESAIMWNSMLFHITQCPSTAAAIFWQTARRQAPALSMVLNCFVWVSPSGQLKAPRCDAFPGASLRGSTAEKESETERPRSWIWSLSLATSNEFHYQLRWRQGLHFLTSGVETTMCYCRSRLLPIQWPDTNPCMNSCCN